MTEPKIRPQDVPDDLVEALLAAANDACVEMPHFEARRILTDLLPATYRYWFAAAFGTPEEIAAREAEASERTPDDTVRLCERARPGEHARQVREQVAAEIERVLTDYQPVSVGVRNGLRRAAAIARKEGR